MIDLSLFDVSDCVWDASWFGFWFLNTVHALYTVDHTCVCAHLCAHACLHSVQTCVHNCAR